MRIVNGRVVLGLMVWLALSAATYRETPSFEEDVAAGKLPPVAERLPENPAVEKFGDGLTFGRPGGSLEILMAKAKDVSESFNIHGGITLSIFGNGEFKIEKGVY